MLIVRQGMALAWLGVALGIAATFGLTKYLESLLNLSQMLYGVKLFDLPTYSVIAFSLTLVALIACYVPARRATKVDPMVALRHE